MNIRDVVKIGEQYGLSLDSEIIWNEDGSLCSGCSIIQSEKVYLFKPNPKKKLLIDDITKPLGKDVFGLLRFERVPDIMLFKNLKKHTKDLDFEVGVLKPYSKSLAHKKLVGCVVKDGKLHLITLKKVLEKLEKETSGNARNIPA